MSDPKAGLTGKGGGRTAARAPTLLTDLIGAEQDRLIEQKLKGIVSRREYRARFTELADLSTIVQRLRAPMVRAKPRSRR